jgi:hypothetical protein
MQQFFSHYKEKKNKISLSRKNWTLPIKDSGVAAGR